jgi:hypothetical protein
MERHDSRGKSTMEMTLEQQKALAIASARVRAQEQEEQQAKTGQRSFGEEALRQLGLTARAGYEAFTAPATAVLEAGRGLYNLAAPESAQLPSFYQAQSAGLRSLGVPEPENMLERGVQAGAQSMLGTAGLARLAPTASPLAGNLSQQIPAAGVAGLTAQPTSEVVSEFTGSPLAGLLASVGMGAITAGGTAKIISSLESSRTPLLSIEQIKQRATQSYRKMDEAGIAVKPLSVQSMVGKIRQSLDDANMVQGTDQARELNTRLAQVENIIGTSKVDFNKIEKIRGIINDLRLSKDADVRRLGSIALGEVDNYITSLTAKDLITGKNAIGPAVKEVVSARKDWRNASRATVLEDALDVATARNLDPKASESELIRRGFINIAADKNKMKLFSTQEQNIIKSVAKGGSLDNLLSLVSRFNPQRSQLATAGTIVGATQSPVIAGSVATAGLGADVLQGVLRRRAAEQAIRQVASGVAPSSVAGGAVPGLFQGIFGPYTQEQ